MTTPPEPEINNVKIETYINGVVGIEVPSIEDYSIDEAYEIAAEIQRAAFRASVLVDLDRVMAQHRGRYAEELLEWRVLDAAWRDLREAFGYGDRCDPWRCRHCGAFSHDFACKERP